MSLASRFDAITKSKLLTKVRRPQLTNIERCKKIIDNIDFSLYKPNKTTIIDMNPGLGLFSQVLNERIKPSRHILLEPGKAYWPTLQEFVDAAPGTEIVDADGHDWPTYQRLFGEEVTEVDEWGRTISFQKQVMPENWKPLEIPVVPAEDGINPHLLFVGNTTDLASARRLTMQFIVASAPAGGWIQRFGRVRYLLWLREEDRDRLYPKIMQTRQRASVIADTLANVIEHTETINTRSGKGYATMVLGKHNEAGKKKFNHRLELIVKIIHDVAIPPGKLTQPATIAKKALSRAARLRNHLEKLYAYVDERHYRVHNPSELAKMNLKELCDLGKQISLNPPTEFVSSVEKSHGDASLDAAAEALTDMPGSYQATKDEAALFKEYELSHLQFNQTCRIARSLPDERYALSLEPPLLQAWRINGDHQQVQVSKKDFSPSKFPLALMDFEPKQVDPYFTAASGDLGIARWRMYEWLVQQLFTTRAQTVKTALAQLAPGGACVLDELPEEDRQTIGDRRVRVLTTDELIKLAKAWEAWEFKPEEMKWGDLGAAEMIVLGQGGFNAWRMLTIDNHKG